MKEEAGLRKDLGLWIGISIVIGCVIGSGIFMKPGRVIAFSGNSTMALLAWLFGGLITMAGGLTIVEVATQIPKTGGLYTYMEEVYGKKVGYLCGFVQSIFYGPAVIGGLGLYFGALVTKLFGWNSALGLAIGIATVIFLAGINLLGTKYGGFVLTAATIGKLVPVILIAVLGIIKGNNGILNMASGADGAALGFGAAVLATLWAYDGWIEVGYVAGEFKNPARTLPIAIIGGIAAVIAAYLLVNIALMHVIAADQIVKLGENSAPQAAMLLLGNMGGKLIAVGIAVSIFGCLNGKILTYPRVPYAMALRDQIPYSSLFAKIPEKFATPVAATLFQIIVAILMMMLSNPDDLTEMAVFVIYIFYILGFFAVFILRKRPGMERRSYSVPLFPLIPIFAIAGASYILISTFMSRPTDCLIALAIAFVGVPLHAFFGRRKAAAESAVGS